LEKHQDPAVHALREGMDRIGIWWGYAAFGGAAMLYLLRSLLAHRIDADTVDVIVSMRKAEVVHALGEWGERCLPTR
jgi:hypothetical protein